MRISFKDFKKEATVDSLPQLNRILGSVVDYGTKVASISFDNDTPFLSVECAKMLVKADIQCDILAPDFKFYGATYQTHNLLTEYLVP